MSIVAASLFSGIGSPEQAMPEWRWAWSAEIEPFASAVLAKRHPQSINLGDVSEDGFASRAARIAEPDVVVFGSPCQSFSVAGRRLGLDDPRGNLALVALRVIAQLRPHWFVFENVPGLRSHDMGRSFGLFLRAVDELGYFGAWASLDAQYFGLAQRRSRLFFVGHSGNWRYPAAILLEPESLCGDSPPRRAEGERVAPTIEARFNAGGAGWGTDFMCDGGISADSEIAGAVSSKWSKGTGGPAGDECYNLIAERISAFSGKDYGADVGEIAPPLRAMSHSGSHANGGGQVAIAFAENSRAELRLEGGDGQTVASLKQGGGKPGQSYAAVANSYSVRRLLPVECEKLQGFPPGYTAIDYRGKPARDGPRYKVLGNAMPVPVMRWILQRIDMLERTV